MKKLTKQEIDYFIWQLNEKHRNIITSLNRQANKETLAHIKKLKIKNIFLCEDKFMQLDHALLQTKVDGVYCEFGVHKAVSTNFIAKKLVGKKLYAFDSFKGLPKDWNTFSKQHFETKKPVIKPNVELRVGWFSDTLPKFASENRKIAFMNIDCDIYESTKEIFDNLGSLIQVGTIIRFDEYWNLPFWQENEYKAFQEFVKTNNIKFDYISFENRFGVVIKITNIGRNTLR